jgi:hypothetical protein
MTHAGHVLSSLSNPHLPVTLRRFTLTGSIIADLQVSATKALGPTTSPAGMVSGDEHWQPASPPIKGPYFPIDTTPLHPPNARTGPYLPVDSLGTTPRSPQQHLNNVRGAGPFRFPLAPNGSLAAFDEPARTWPRRFPSKETPQLASGEQNLPALPPRGPGAAAENPIVLDSIETNTTPTQTTTPAAPQNNAPENQHAPLPNPLGCVTQSIPKRGSPLSALPISGYQWSDPTAPGYRRTTPPHAPALKPKMPRIRSVAERESIAGSLAFVAMTQEQGGFMEEYVKFLATDILDKVIVEYNEEAHAENTSK